MRQRAVIDYPIVTLFGRSDRTSFYENWVLKGEWFTIRCELDSFTRKKVDREAVLNYRVKGSRYQIIH